jgi:flavin reductase (DIM6/NTAB) family NADH-FMN oxidoreductase RutF
MKSISIHKAFSIAKRERVVFVITIKPDGKPNIMPVSWNMKCSSNPPMFAVAIKNNQYTPRLIETTGEFVIAIANKKLIDLVEFSGTTSGSLVDKFGKFPFGIIPAGHILPPLLAEATVNFECKLQTKAKAGDYTIYVGAILAAYQHETESKTLLTMKKENGKRIYHEL